MKKSYLLLVFITILSSYSFSQAKQDTTKTRPAGSGLATEKPKDAADSDSTDQKESENKIQNQFNALVNYNFAGNNKGLSNLTPIIHLGTELEMKKISESVSWVVDFDPYIGSQISTKDSFSLIPALMLYGNGGIAINNYLKFKVGNENVFTIAPVNFGVKFLNDFLDSGNLLIQHNLRFGMAYEQKDKFMIGFQLTQGWHNLSSESERFYKKVFTRESTSISYLTISLQVKLNEKVIATDGDKEVQNSWFAFFEWRGLLSKEPYAAFTNNKIFTIGLRRDMGLRNIFYAAKRSSAK